MQISCPSCNGSGRASGNRAFHDMRCIACRGTRIQNINHQFQVNRHLRRAHMKAQRSGPIPVTLAKGETPCAS